MYLKWRVNEAVRTHEVGKKKLGLFKTLLNDPFNFSLLKQPSV